MRIEPPDAVTQEILASGFKHIAEEMAVVE